MFGKFQKFDKNGKVIEETTGYLFEVKYGEKTIYIEKRNEQFCGEITFEWDNFEYISKEAPDGWDADNWKANNKPKGKSKLERDFDKLGEIMKKYTTDNTYTYIETTETKPFISGSGWVCPKCGSVYAPTTTECIRCNPPYKVTCTF